MLAAIEATRRVVSTNTNLGMVLLLAPLAAVPRDVDLADGIEGVLADDDGRRRTAGLSRDPPGSARRDGRGTRPGRRPRADDDAQAVMALAAERDLVARQYANGFREVLGETLPALRESLQAGSPIETAIVAAFLRLLARHPDSLIVRKHGLAQAIEVSCRAAELIDAGWPECEKAWGRLGHFDSWLRHAGQPIQPRNDGRPDHRRLVRRVARWDNSVSADVTLCGMNAVRSPRGQNT